jgi:hypothetical protein
MYEFPFFPLLPSPSLALFPSLSFSLSLTTGLSDYTDLER